LNKQRLLNVAKALREAPVPEKFDMGRHVHTCGTPSCAFGHYAARSDLQDEFSIDSSRESAHLPYQGVYLKNGAGICFSDDVVLTHFDLDEDDIGELFGSMAANPTDNNPETYARLARTCQTPIEAAEYIEQFVARRAGPTCESTRSAADLPETMRRPSQT
jgi:hypothetical protein